MKHGRKIGVGNTAAVYEWGEGKALKLFYQGYPSRAVEREFHNAKAVGNMKFSKPHAYEIVFCKGRMGIIYDRVPGESLQDWAMRTRDMQGCAVRMARLHKAILQNRIDNVPDYKEFLRQNIASARSIPSDQRRQAMRLLNSLQDGNTLCHGDFHPGNIFISNEHTTVVDFMNVCHGNCLYDVARTVFLVEFTPVPAEAQDRNLILQFKKTLADLYLVEMNVTREMIQDCLSVIIASRIGECPNEQPDVG